MKPEFSRQISEKSSNIKLYKNLYCESRVFYAVRQTDGHHDEVSSRFSQCCDLS
jgi:hypothetical protein